MRNTDGLTVFSVLVNRGAVGETPTSIAILAPSPITARKLAIAAYRQRNELSAAVPVYSAIDLRGCAA